jgi:flavin reductase (DIM6/NTAB) family NADH-FMN oxidoreductase RutF
MTAIDEQVTGDEPGGLTATAFRDAIGHFATGVTVVTSVGADGAPVGTTASAVTSLSLDPPLVLVCFDRGSQTLAAVQEHGAFVINVLAAPQRHLSANFARRGLAAAWDGIQHRRGLTGSPRLEGTLAALECTVEYRLPGGDHEIVVGRVREVETNRQDTEPLLYWRGGYASLGVHGGSAA